MYARRTRFLILGAVITIGLMGVILLQAPEPTRAVDDLMEDPDAFIGKRLQCEAKCWMAASTTAHWCSFSMVNRTS